MRCGGLLLAAALVQVPWIIRNHVVAFEPPADQTLLYSYVTGMFHADMGDPESPLVTPAEVVGRFPLRSGQIASVLSACLVGGGGGPALVTLVALACSAWVLVRRRASVELFLLMSLLIIAFYFGFADRLIVPVFILVLPNVVAAIRDLVGALAGRRVGVAAGVLVVVALAARTFEPTRDWDRFEREHVALRALCDRFEKQVRPDARLGTQRGWFYAVYLDRPVYSFEFAVKRARNPAAAEAIIDKYELDTVVLSPLGVKDQEVLPYFEARYGPSSGVARVYRVRP